MPIKWLELLEVLVVDLLGVSTSDQLEIVAEVQANDVQVEVLLKYFVRLQQLIVLLLHVHLNLNHVFEQLLPFLHSFLGEVRELLLCLVHFLLHRFSFEVRLVPQVLQLLLEVGPPFYQELLAVLFLLFELPVFVEDVLLQFDDLLAEALGDLGDVRASEGLLLLVDLAALVVDDVAFVQDLAGVFPFGLGVGPREVRGGAEASVAEELRASVVAVCLAQS